MFVAARKTILGLVLAASLALGVCAAQAANLVPNPGFEATCGSVPCNWTAILSTIASDTVNFHSGSASLLATSGSQQTFGARSDCFSISPSTTYSLGGWYRTTVQNPVGAGLYLFEYSDAACGTLVPGSAFVSSPLPLVKTGVWTFFGGRVTTGATIHSAQLQAYANCQVSCPATNTMNWDDLDLSAVTPGIHIVKFVNGQDANSATGPHVAVGSTVTFTYVVTNTGNVPLASVGVTDDKLGSVTSFTGDTNTNGLLDTTETWTYTKTATALAGQQANVGTAAGQDASPPNTVVSGTDPANYFGDVPGIQIVKFVNGQDANSATGPHVPVGSTVTFTYVVTNTGNVPLDNLAVTDDKLGSITSFVGDTNGNGLLDVTETWTYTTSATALLGQQTNTGMVVGLPVSPGVVFTVVTDTDTANYFGDSPTAVTLASASAARASNGVLVRWRTGTETDLLGFQVYRSRGHSWQRLTRSLIAAKGFVSGHSYRFLDRTARRGVSYRYRIRAVNRDGTTAWFGPVRVS